MNRLAIGSVVLVVTLVSVLWAAAPASAEEFKLTVLCKTSPESGECAEEDVVPAGSSIVAKATNPTMSTTITGGLPVVVTCEKSTLEGKTTESSETLELRAEVSGLTFSGCKSSSKSCTVKALGLPYSAAFAAKAGSPGDGRLVVWDSPGEARPAVDVECTGLGFHCLYEAAEKVEVESTKGSVNVIQQQVQGGNPATASAEAAPFEAKTPKGGNCIGSKKGQFSANWEFSAPSPLHVERASIIVEVDPRPVVILKVGETVAVDVENVGLRPWFIFSMFADAGKVSIVEIEDPCMPLILESEEQCRVGLKCEEKGTWEFDLLIAVPSTGQIVWTTPPVECEVP